MFDVNGVQGRFVIGGKDFHHRDIIWNMGDCDIGYWGWFNLPQRGSELEQIIATCLASDEPGHGMTIIEHNESKNPEEWTHHRLTKDINIAQSAINQCS